MGTTRTDVVNEALMACEQPPVASIDGVESWMVKVRARYAAQVKRMLERHPWNFATQRAQLTAADTTPIGRSFAYVKPADVARIVQINDTGDKRDDGRPDYEDEAGYILTDWDPCYLFYISTLWLNKEGAWPQHFADAVSMQLAWRVYPLFGKNETKRQSLRSEAKTALGDARAWDAAQVPWKRNPRGSWNNSRRRFSGRDWPS